MTADKVLEYTTGTNMAKVPKAKMATASFSLSAIKDAPKMAMENILEIKLKILLKSLCSMIVISFVNIDMYSPLAALSEKLAALILKSFVNI